MHFFAKQKGNCNDYHFPHYSIEISVVIVTANHKFYGAK